MTISEVDKRKLVDHIATKCNLPHAGITVQADPDLFGGASVRVSVPAGEGARVSKRIGDEFERHTVVIDEQRHSRG